MKRIAALLLALLSPSACNQDSQAKRQIYGELDADEIDVASRLPGRVKKILVQPGQAVKAGDVLVQFEDDLMAAKRQGAEATIAAAESRSAIANDAVRPEEKAQLRAAVEAARQQTEFAKKSLDRTEILLKDGAVPQQTVDELRFKWQASQEQLNAAQAKLKLAESGARPEEKAGAAAVVAQAKTLLAEVEAYEKDLSLKAPTDGEVVQILNHEGELVPTGYPVVTLLRMDKPWVTLNLPETRLKELPKDADVQVRLPSLGDQPLAGKVTYVAPMGSFATKTFTQDRSSFDLKTFEVRITLTGKAEGLRPGMTAVVQPVAR